ncbi:MAG: response regulator [Bacteroidales bacterium]|nr:response regulator [Candidatus Latescibacterota bacterium]
MKETSQNKPGTGKQKKPANRDRSVNTGKSDDGILGLETNLYICKRLLESGSVSKALQEISEYIRDLFDLTFALVITEESNGRSLRIATVSSGNNLGNFLKGLTYQYGTSEGIDKWLYSIFDSDKGKPMGMKAMKDIMAWCETDRLITGPAFTSVVDMLATHKSLNALSFGKKNRDDDPFLVLIVSADRTFSATEKRLLDTIADYMSITVERRFESEGLDRKLTRYKALVDSKEHAFFLLIDGKLEFFSGQLPEILGVSGDKLAGRRLEEFLHPDDRRDFEKMLSVFLASEPGPAKKYYHIYRLEEGGDEVEMQIHLIEFRGKTAIRGTLENVSQRSMLEKTAVEAKHLETLASLAGGVAHDFNNLIGAMVGYASLVRNTLPDDDERVRQLGKIEEAGARANKLTKQLLSMSRKGKYALEVVDMSDIIDQTTKGCLIPLDHISLVKNNRAELLNVEGDPSQLYEALLNIFMNARESMPDGGLIEVSIENSYIDETHQVFSGGMMSGEYVEIRVKDKGSGMDSSVLRRSPEPFFTMRGERKHKGLGLPAAIGIIEGHRGKIDMTSRPEEGTEVIIYLPVTKKTPQDSVQFNPLHTTACRVLIVDDEQIILDLASDMLTRLGYVAVIAESGIRALEILEDKKIDLVLLDLLMPEMSGQETFFKLKEKIPDLPIIISSGYSEDMVIRDLLDAGALSFLKKPYRLKDMTAILQNALGAIGSASVKGE